jgi:hypothetical protein
MYANYIKAWLMRFDIIVPVRLKNKMKIGIFGKDCLLTKNKDRQAGSNHQ